MVHACLPYSLTVTTDLQYVTPPLYAEVFNGTLGTSPTSDSLVWDTTLVKINFMAVSNDNPGVYLFNYGSAWNEDGSVGYIYFFGVDSTDRPFHYSVEPIVYKSTTHGATWVKQPVFNFSTISTIEDSIRPVDNDATLRIPFIPGGDASGNEQAGSVDNNGQLHIVTGVYGGSSSDPDSAAYSYTGDVERLYDIHTKVGGGWDATYITAMQCAIVSPTDPGALYYSSTQNIGWNHRIHISRTTDGTKMFATWIDDTLTTSVTMVTLPELMAYGWDNTNGHHTQLTNFTSNTAFDGTCYWKYAADRVLTSGSTYTIPVTTTLPNTTALATDPCTHYYLTGVTFDDADFVGINELKNNVSFVSQNYPNPFDKTTTISVKLSTPSNLTLLVSNMLGQKVYEMNYGTVSAGTHTYTFDGSKLQSGIYFYTVKAGEDSDTHKMVIE
jgi:hypothetical protein